MSTSAQSKKIRTTVTLPAELLRAIRIVAARQGLRPHQFIVKTLTAHRTVGREIEQEVVK